jgi:tRNA-specific 2-thiouridylase
MKIAIGLSGGVDSSLAASLLKEQGHELHGVFMKNWSEKNEQCTITQDWQDAQSVAERLNIPIELIDFSQEYWDNVFEVFLNNLEKGLTPSPDILCNQHVKFGAFLKWALAKGFDGIATGHYASISSDHQLQKARDEHKDQTYFLWSVNPSLWRYVRFPLGSLLKSEVREQAAQRGLHTATKKDSTGICFIGPKNFKDFLKRYLLSEKGPICLENGQIIGHHTGLFSYTLGQRSGMNIGGVKNALEAPFFVIRKDLQSNTLIVSQDQHHPLLLKKELFAEQCVWQRANDRIAEHIFARIRHGQMLQKCSIHFLENKTVHIQFEEAQRAITPGQAIVFYDGNFCLGGGWIV